MVCRALKGKRLGKDGKTELLAQRTKAVESHRNRDDKRWKRILAKMDTEKKKSLAGLGFTSQRGRRRGATRASLRKKTGRREDNLTYECTIHLAKLIKGKSFRKRAPMAVKKIKHFVQNLMKTKDNRIDASLNTHLWHRGVKGCPGRVRVRIQRKVAENTEGASKHKRLYTVVSYVPVPSFTGLTSKIVTA